MDSNDNDHSANDQNKTSTKMKINRLRDLHQVKDLESQDIDYLIFKIEQYKGDNSTPMIENYTLDFIMMLIDKDKINEIDRKFKSIGKKGVDIIDFTRVLITSIDHKPNETLYITLALIDLFKEISESRGMSPTITFNDFTGFVCDYFVEKNITTYLLPTVKMPEQKKFNTNQKKIRDIDINPPILFGKTEDGIKRLLPNSLITDSSKHNNQSIIKGLYASGYRRIITLDSLSTNLKVYKLNSTFERVILPQSQKDKEVIIIGFTYSEREQRIGATLKDVSLIFWDKQDQFKFQKCFTVNAFVQDYQTNIWYLNNTQSWITTDKTNAINIWDLEHEVLKKQILSKEITGSINEIVEIIHIKLVAVSSLDKKVTVWDLDKENIIFTLELGHAGIHHLLYSYQFQCLITSGFENTINVYSINPQYLDYDSLGKLVGHSSMVTAIQIVDKTPMVVSADDMGNIKIWDIRSLKCLQTINIGCKTSLTHIINVPDKNMICLLGTRVNFISFDNSHVQRSNEDAYPIKVEFNMIKQEISVCTRKDMRFLRMKDGKITKIFTGLLQNSDDEIATCSSINQFKNFILGDHKGGLGLYSYNNGEKIKDLVGHQSEVSQVKIDFPNKMIISSSWDSSIILQRETPSGVEIKRIIKNAHFKKEVNQMEISLYHNIIVTGSSSRKIYIWDYEFVKLIACIEIDRGTEPTGFTIINGYRLLFISTNLGFIYILKFNIKEFKASFELIGVINLNTFQQNQINKDTQYIQSLNSDEYDDEKSDTYQSKISQKFRRDSGANNSQTTANQIASSNLNNNADKRPSLTLNLSNNVGTTSQVQQGQEVLSHQASVQQTNQPVLKNQQQQQQQSTFAQEMKKKNNKPQIKTSAQTINVGISFQTNEKSNPLQTSNEKFNQPIPSSPRQNQKNILRQSNDSQFYGSDTFSKQKKKDPSPKNNPERSNDSSFCEDKLPQEWPTKLLTEMQTDEETKVMQKCLLFVATNKGNIFTFNIDSIIQQDEIKISDHSTQRLNYNPLRQCSEDFYSQIEQIGRESIKIPQIIQQNEKQFKKLEKQVSKVGQFVAHRDLLTSFQFVEINNKCLLTSSQDQYVRIWTLQGELIGNLNINHPLPIKWKMQFDHHEKVKKKVFYALKILDIMLSKYKADSNLRKVMQIEGFINSLLPPQKVQMKLNLQEVKDIHITSLNDQTKGIIFMNDEFSPRDLKYNDIKLLFEKELRGISLKQMEANKRLMQAQQEADDNYQAPEIDIHAKRRKHEEHEMVQFFAPNWRNRVLQKQLESEHSKNVYMLGRKMEQKIKDKQKLLNKARYSTINQQQEGGNTEDGQNTIQQQQRNSQVSNNQLTPGKQVRDEQRQYSQKQNHKAQLSPRKQDDQSRFSKQEISSNQFISIIEKEETPRQRQKKGSKMNIQLNFDGSSVIENSENKQKQQRKDRGGRYKSLDYLEYASEKNYLDESILHLSTVGPSNSSQNINTNNNTLINSTAHNISVIPQQQYQYNQISGDAVNTSIANLQSSMISKNNSTTIIGTERSSIVSHNSVSANNLQKAKMQVLMKNINSKLRQSRYQTDKVILDKYEHQLNAQNQLQSDRTTNYNSVTTTNHVITKHFLQSIVPHTILDTDQSASPPLFDNKLNLFKRNQLQSNMIKPIFNSVQKSILDTLKEDNFISGSMTERMSHNLSSKQFQLRLPSIQSGMAYHGQNDSKLPSTIRSAKNYKYNK